MNIISSQFEQISRDIRSLQKLIRCQALQTLFDEIHIRLFALEAKFQNFCHEIVSQQDLRNLYDNRNYGRYEGIPSENSFHKICSFAAKRSNLEDNPATKPVLERFGF